MIFRALLFLLACLLALASPASARSSISRQMVVPPPVPLFCVEFSEGDDAGPLTLHLDGLHDRAGPHGRFLVRQNPWSKFDPEGLAELEYGGIFNRGAQLDPFEAANTGNQIHTGPAQIGHVAEALGAGASAMMLVAPGPKTGVAGAAERTAMTFESAGKVPNMFERTWGAVTGLFRRGGSAAEESAVTGALKNADLAPTQSAAANMEKAQAAADAAMAAAKGEAGGADVLNMGKRLDYMGKTPGKSSATGKAVIERMIQEGKARMGNGGLEVQNSTGQWVPAATTDMSHIKDAVKAWNEGLHQTGPRSGEVRKFMKDPSNYELDSSSINRSKGAKLNETYRDPETR